MAIPILRLLPIAWFILEVVVLVEVGRALGALATVGLLLGAIVLGSLILRHAGMSVVASLMTQGQPGRPPMERLRSAGWQVVAGLLLIVPGFISDVLALLLFLPPVRKLLARMMPVTSCRGGSSSVIEGEAQDITPDGAGTRPSHLGSSGHFDARDRDDDEPPADPGARGGSARSGRTNPWSPSDPS